MIPIFKWIEYSQRNRKAFRIFDWTCAIAMLAYAAYAQSWGWAVSGVIAGIVAWWDPAGKVPKLIQSRVVKRPKV
jgi:hypothetical protein